MEKFSSFLVIMKMQIKINSEEVVLAKMLRSRNSWTLMEYNW